VLPPIRRFFRWLKAVRDPDDDGLVAIIQPDESGLDASPKYDALMGISPESTEETLPELQRSMQRLYDAYAPYRSEPARIPTLDVFTWEDVMVNAIYADGLRCLAKLMAIAGDPPTRRRVRRAATRVRHARDQMLGRRRGGLWTLRVGREAGPNPHVQLPLSAHPRGSRTRERPNDSWMSISSTRREFWLPYPIPSVAASERAFDPGWRAKTTWRGPTWIT